MCYYQVPSFDFTFKYLTYILTETRRGRNCDHSRNNPTVISTTAKSFRNLYLENDFNVFCLHRVSMGFCSEMVMCQNKKNKIIILSEI